MINFEHITRRSRALAFALTALAMSNSFASDEVLNDVIERLAGTTSIEFRKATAQGVDQSCELLYKALIFDTTYHVRKPYWVYGSLGVNATGKRVFAVGLKVFTSRVAIKDRKITSTPERPHFAFLRSPSGIQNASSVVDNSNSATPGAILVIYPLDDNFSKIFAGIVVERKVSIVFNRKKGGMDIEVPLDLTVTDVMADGSRLYSVKAVDDFIDCATELVKFNLSK